MFLPTPIGGASIEWVKAIDGVVNPNRIYTINFNHFQNILEKIPENQ